MQVGKISISKIDSLFPELCVFHVDIDGIKTRGIANYAEGYIFIHWRNGGRRVLYMKDYNNHDGNMSEFIADKLENAPLMEDYQADNKLDMPDLFEVKEL